LPICARPAISTLVRCASGEAVTAARKPWQGDPGVSFQAHEGMANAYHMRQVLKAIDRLEVQSDVEKCRGPSPPVDRIYGKSLDFLFGTQYNGLWTCVVVS
jgi:hypothetical protein